MSKLQSTLGSHNLRVHKPFTLTVGGISLSKAQMEILNPYIVVWMNERRTGKYMERRARQVLEERGYPVITAEVMERVHGKFRDAVEREMRETDPVRLALKESTNLLRHALTERYGTPNFHKWLIKQINENKKALKP